MAQTDCSGGRVFLLSARDKALGVPLSLKNLNVTDWEEWPMWDRTTRSLTRCEPGVYPPANMPGRYWVVVCPKPTPEPAKINSKTISANRMAVGQPRPLRFQVRGSLL